MHIPYGLLSTEVSLATAAAAAPWVGWALWRVQRRYEERAVPLMGMLGAFIFAAQMVNFPVAAGTSGHLLGAALATLLLGAPAAMLVLTAVVVVQAVVFQDGAITALGANVLNMAVLGVLATRLVFSGWTRVLGTRWRAAGVLAAALVSIVVPAAACAAEVAASRLYPLPLVLGAMTGIHLLIGAAEALITLAVLRCIAAVRPELTAGLLGKGGGHAPDPVA